jgi:hypothetical protein
VLSQLILTGASKLQTDACFPLKQWRSKMKTLIATLALVLLATGTTFAAPFAWQIDDGRASAFAPGHSMDVDTSREGMIRATH